MAKAVAIVSSVEQEKEERARSWSDLPPEVLSLILSNLFAADYSFFHATCRSWRSISAVIRPLPPPIDSPLHQSPCLMFVNGNNFTFFHPIYNAAYHMDIPELMGAVIRFSKHGWLLMSQGKFGAFFFNPFTKVRIGLPNALINIGFNTMCFSSPPNSSDCVVIGVASVYHTGVYIGIIKRGEEQWTIGRYENNRRFKTSCCNPVLYNGLYYCLGDSGIVGIIDPKDNKCNWTVCGKRPGRAVRKCKQSFMMESEGNLLAVFVSYDGSQVYVYRLDFSSMAWQEVRGLENKMLYVSHSASVSEMAVVTGTGNNIYFPRLYGNNCLFYSLATRKNHSFVGGYCSGKFNNTRELKYCTWIKPMVATGCHEQTNW